MYGQLGSGLFNLAMPQAPISMPLGSGMFAPQPVPLKKKFPLGSGFFDPQEAPGGAMPLGSGMFGQQMPMPNIEAGAAPGAQVQNNMNPQPAAQAAPQKASFDERLGAALQTPSLQMGLSLLGGANQPNPWGNALQSTLAAQAQAAQAQRAKAQQALMEKQFGLTEKQFGLTEKRFEHETDMAGKNYDLAQERLNMGYDEMDMQRQKMEQQAAQFQQQQAIAAMHAETQRRHADLGERKFGLDERQLAAQIPLYEAQAQQYGTQGDLKRQEIEIKRRQFEQQQQWLNQLSGTMGGLFQQPQPQAEGGMQQQSMPLPQGGAVGKHGTPTALLDALAQVESSGNPKAVNKESGAMGMFQFMPGTVDMLSKQGVQFDPFDPQGSRDAADYYLQQLLEASGGDYRKALASYGGFKTKDPTPYINKIAKAAQQPQLAQQPQVQGPTADRSMQLAQAGVMASAAGLPGGSQLLDFAKMAQPQNVPAGGYTRDPVSGTMNFNRDPYEETRITQGERRVELDETKAQQEIAKAERERSTQLASVDNSYNATLASLSRLAKSAGELKDHEGLATVGGWSGFVGMHKLPGKGRDAAAKLDTLKNQVVIETLKNLKAMSATGASGFGQLSEKEGARLENSVANLEAAQTDEQLKAAVAEIEAFAKEAMVLSAKAYQGTRLAQGADPLPPGAADITQQGQASQGGGVMTPEQYMQYRQQRRK